MPVFLYWFFGSLAVGMILLYVWPHDHSTGSLVFYGVVAAGIMLGLVHRTVVRRRATATEPPAGGGNDV